MQELSDWMEYIEDVRQARKVRHKLKDILAIVLSATLANADDWVEMAHLRMNIRIILRDASDWRTRSHPMTPLAA